jgi:hypothetical protein
MAKRVIKLLAAILTAILLLAGFVGIQWSYRPHKSAAHACLVNLRQLATAKQEWGLEHHASPTNTPTWEDLRPYLWHQQILTCPSGGKYTIGRLDQDPTCSHPGDVLP